MNRYSCALTWVGVFLTVLCYGQEGPPPRHESSRPQESSSPQVSVDQATLQQLLRRIETLEQQNRELREALQRLQENVTQPPRPQVLEQNTSRNFELSAAYDAPPKKPSAVDPDELKNNPWRLIELHDPSPWIRVSWQHGLGIQTPDGNFRVHVGGRTQFDTVWVTAQDRVEAGPGGIGKPRDAFAFRRGRFTIDGKLYRMIEFVSEYDFVNTFDADPLDPAREGDVANTPVPTDLWAQIVDIPFLGTIRVGNQKPPISFEHITSSRWLNFLERSFMFDAFIGGLDNGFRPGVQVFNWSQDETITWAFGVFKNNNTVFGWNVGDGEYDLTGRLTWTPIYAEDGKYLIHVGLGASGRDLDNDRYRLRARTMLRNGPAPLHTALSDVRFLGDTMYILVPEFALVWGPWSMVAEYYATWFTDVGFPIAAPAPFGTTFYHGGYIEVLYFLTGEYRHYLRHGGSGAAFNRVIPDRNFIYIDRDGEIIFAPGAWQVGIRYQYIDLVDKGIPGAILHDVTLGLNWFPNANIRFQWNYTFTHRDLANSDADGWVHGFGMRMAYDF
ncbi:MAG: porin [Gemmatales bacterium]|nr:porin [Gemmatales bacterium]MDW8223789.1 porin [Gemmatales bacterium]